MNQLVPIVARAPALIAVAGERASYRFFEFFTEPPRVCRRPQLLRVWGHGIREDEHLLFA